MEEREKQEAAQKMRPIDVYDNLKNFNAWDYSSYPMNKAEADVCMAGLKVLMNLDRITEGK